MARTVTVNTGILRYIDSASPNVNNGGSKIKFGFWQKSKTERQTFTMLCKFSVDEIAGGIPIDVNIKFYTENVSANLTRYAAMYAYQMESAVQIQSCSEAEAIASIVGQLGIDYVSISELADGGKAAIAAGEFLTLVPLSSTNQETNNNYLNSFLKYPLYIDSTNRPADMNYETPPYGITGEFAAFGTAHPPVMTVILEEAAISVGNATPASGFINKTISNTFSWNIVYDTTNVVGTIKPATAKFRWKDKNAAAYTEVAVTGAFYTVPANTFSSNDIQWQVEVTSDAGTVATSEWYTVSTIDAAAIAAPISPVNQKLNRDEANTFKWNHSTENGTAQTAADLQYSVDNLNWQSLAAVEGSQQSVTVAAGTLPLGTVFWRVRTYNANGVAGAWSDSAVITVVGAVPSPIISSITGNAMPVISWSAQIQQAYQVQIQAESGIVFDSGAQLGTAKTYNIKTLLPDGQYTAQVRVYADNGTASAWAASPFAISTTKPTTPVIAAQSGKGYVTLTVAADSTDTVYILRDGIPIGIAQNGMFTDYSGVGQSIYTARSVSSDNRYADSAPVTAAPIIAGSIIAAADDPNKLVSLTLNLRGMPSREFNWSPIGSIVHYAGRKYPDYQYTEQEEESYNFSFAFRTKAEFDAFVELCKKRGTVLYRDQYGLKFYGVITGVSPNVQWAGWAVTFSMTRVDYSEAVSYV